MPQAKLAYTDTRMPKRVPAAQHGLSHGFVRFWRYAIAARTRKFNDDYYKGEQLRDPGPGRRQPRQHAEGQRRDEEEAVEPIQDAAVAREEMPEVLDVRVPF